MSSCWRSDPEQFLLGEFLMVTQRHPARSAFGVKAVTVAERCNSASYSAAARSSASTP